MSYDPLLNFNPDGHPFAAEPLTVSGAPHRYRTIQHSIRQETPTSVEIWQNSNKTGTRLIEEPYTGTVSASGRFQVDYDGVGEAFPKLKNTILFHAAQAGTSWFVWYKSQGNFTIGEIPRIPRVHGNEAHSNVAGVALYFYHNYPGAL